MNRRSFIQSITALGLTPVLPSGNLVTKVLAAPVNVIAPISKYHCAEYKWAEILVRAHKTCSIDFLRRHLKVGPGQAENLQAELIRKGVISAAKNAYGFHQATKSLWEEHPSSFKPRLEEMPEKGAEKLADLQQEAEAYDDKIAVNRVPDESHTLQDNTATVCEVMAIDQPTPEQVS